MIKTIGPEEYDLPRELSVSFTGHRPEKLPWGEDESDPRCEAFRKRLSGEILKAYSEGARYFLSGMAEGVDTYAAEAVLALAKKCPGMELVCVYPFGSCRNKRDRRIAGKAHTVVSMHASYVPACFHDRDGFLVRHSCRIIAGFEGDMKSGTGVTLRFARREGIGITILGFGADQNE